MLHGINSLYGKLDGRSQFVNLIDIGLRVLSKDWKYVLKPDAVLLFLLFSSFASLIAVSKNH